MKKGQGMFEYVLLLAGILLIVVLAIVLLRGGLFGGAEKDVGLTNCRAAISRNSLCYDQATQEQWKPNEAIAQPDACKFVDLYKDDGAALCDNAISGDGKIRCCDKPGTV